jgi:VIT1/CCC1 family predicted Fe2+/Mn2+ transporter
MALSFMLGGSLPLIPYILLNGRVALGTSALAAAVALYGVGAFKGQLSGQSRFRSGTLFFGIAVGSAILGYGIGLIADALVPGAGAAAAAAGM